MRWSLPASRRDADDRASTGAPRRAGRLDGARRWVLAAAVGCIVLFAVAPVAVAAGTGKIEGTVTESTGTHKGLENISVTVYGLNEEFVGSASTNANGEYTVTGLSEGQYKTKFSNEPKYASQYYDKQLSFASATPISVTEGKTTSGIDAALQEPGKISGEVTNLAGVPLSRVDVEVTSASADFDFEITKSASTNANGEYTVEGLPEGEYRVGFFPNESTYRSQYYNDQASFTAANLVHVTAGGTTSGIGAALKEGGKISGTVTDSVTHGRLAKIAVYAFSANPEVEGYSSGFAETNANGEYTVVGLSTGSFKVEFYWEFSEAESKACEHAPRCIPRYITQYFNNQPSPATANAVGATEGGLTSGINAVMVPSVPVNTALPVVSGTPTVGSVLSCSNGSWTGEPELTLAVGWPLTTPFTYQWLRDGAPIAGATSAAYVVQAADVGHGLVCEVAATNDAGHASARSSSLAVTKPTPVVSTSASKLTVSKSATKVSVACANASCAGSAEVIERIVVKRHKGKKTTSKKETVVLAKGSYVLAVGKTGNVTLRVTAAGKKRLAHASKHRVSAKLVISVKGGKQIEKTVQLSS
jgi:hypothetical protein